MSSKFASGKRNVSATINLLQSLGVADITSRRGKHVKISGTYRGQKVATVVSVTPSDWRGHLNNICQIKRQVRAIDNADT